MRAKGGLAAVVAAYAIVAGVAAADAAPANTPEAAYWWQPEPVSGLVPVPGVPPDGLYVAASSTGPQAEAAVRFSVASPTAFVRLTLHVSNQERVGKPAVLSYPATSHWQTGGPQPWSARPSYRASARPTKGFFSHAGSVMTLTFPAQEAASGIVLVPDPNASNQNFTIAFAPPRSSDIAFERTDTSRPTTPPSSTPSRRPTQSPTAGHHAASGSPSGHPGKSAKPAHSPSATSGPPTPASPSSSSAPPSVTVADTDNTQQIVLIVIGALVALGAVGGIVAGRRRS